MYYTSKEVYEFVSKQTNPAKDGAGDPIVERKICRASGQAFAIYQSDVDFYEKISPTFDGKKFHIPTPTLCPEERQRRRLLFRNERKLYRRSCDATNKPIISLYSPDPARNASLEASKPYKVYDQKVRWSDQRDPMSYGRDFDFGKTFGEQFSVLINMVPFMSIMNDNGINSVNSEYCNNFSYGKNCYMIHTSRHGEDSMYASSCQHISNTYDCTGMGNTENCYECTDSNKLLDCFFVAQSTGCDHCWYSKQLTGCSHCFGCVNLTNQQFCIFNKQYTKEEYIPMCKELTHALSTKKDNDILASLRSLSNNLPALGLNVKGSTDSFGDGMFDCKNIFMGFNIYHGINCKYYYGGSDSPRDSYDITVGGDHDYGYESIVPDFSYQSLFTIYCWKCKFIMYSFDCHNSSNLFGCIGLRNKSYCIFNKQYTKEEYEKTVAKIIEQMQTPHPDPLLGGEGVSEWGEFFDPSMSPFGYNETVAQEYFPLTREEALARGYKRQDQNYDPQIPEGAEVIRPSVFSDQERQALRDDAGITKKIFVCEASGRPFLLQKAEVEFYRKHHLPLPKKHPDVRHEERMKQRSPRELHFRTCDTCGKEMVSVYSVQNKAEYSESSEELKKAESSEELKKAESSEGTEVLRKENQSIASDEMRVYCEDCYQREVYG